jgi:tetratricopeptide (TPR) repeat protein
MRLLLCVIGVLFGFGLHAEDAWQGQLDAARALAADGKHLEAIEAYSAVISKIPAGDPRKESFVAERILSYYGAKAYAETEKECLRFLKTYRSSEFGFTVSYVLAAAQFGLKRYGEALKIFSNFDVQQIRALESGPKEKVYDVIIRSLVGLDKKATSIAFRADLMGLLKGADGSPLLNGKVNSLVQKIPTRTELEVLIASVPAEADREQIRALFDDEAHSESAPFDPVYGMGIGVFRDSMLGPQFTQVMTQLRGFAELPITKEGSALGVKAEVDVVGFGSSLAQTQVKTLRGDFYLKGAMFSEGDFYFDFNLGFFYRTASASPTSFAYSDTLGGTFSPSVGFRLGGGMDVALALWYSPITSINEAFDGFNNAFGLSVNLGFVGLWNKRNSIFLEYDKTRFRSVVLATQFEMVRVGLGYRFQF